MKKYIGVKLIDAKKMDKVEFSFLQNLEYLGENEDGYLVKYEDGYTSWIPKYVFEEEYRPLQDMTFGLAIEAMKKGHKVARKGWNGNGMWVELQIPDKYSKMSLPYIYMKTTDNKLVPWLASQTDMLAEDWEIITNKIKGE